MSLLSMLFGGASRGRAYGRRSYGGGFGRGLGSSYGRGRVQQSGFFSSPIGRMAMGGLATYAARRFMGRRRMY